MQSFKNISIKNKLILIQSVTAFFAILICSVIFVINDISTFKESSVRKMYSIARIVGDNSASALVFTDQESANKVLHRLDKEPDIKGALIIDKTGKDFGKYARAGEDAASYVLSNSTQTVSHAFSGKNMMVTYKIFQENEYLGTLILKVELTDLNKIVSNYIIAAALVLLAGLMAAFLISVFLQRAISSRLSFLVSKTKTISETGNYSIRVSSEGKDEISTLSQEFNNMLEQIESMESSLEKRIKERTLELETANKEMESFSYSVSHDLRAPIRAINGFGEVLAKKNSDQLDADGKEYLKTIIHEAGRMGQLIDDLLVFSRLGKKEIQKTSFDMNLLAKKAVDEVLNLSQEKYNAKITVKDLPAADCDVALMNQVFINLISNALKYSKPNPNPVIEIGASADKNVVTFYVKDNGVGFDMKHYNKLFGVFQRLHGAEEFEGTGIGLAIVQKIISRHYGKVWAEAKINEGATFYFSLPKKNASASLSTSTSARS